jgi:hypothetical protein
MMTRNRFPIQLLATLMLIALATPYARPATCGMMPHPMDAEHMAGHDMATSADHNDCDDCTESADCCAASLAPAIIGETDFPALHDRVWQVSQHVLSVHVSQPHSTTPPPQA